MSLNYTELANVLAAGHPGTGAYDADAQTAADQMNAENISDGFESMTGSQFMQLTDAAELGAVTDHKRALWVSFCGITEHDPANGGIAHQMVEYVFGASSTTESTLAANRVARNISHATQVADQINYSGEITLTMVQKARGEI